MGEYHQHIQSTSHHTQLADPSHPHRHHHIAGKQSAQTEEKFGFMETTTTDSFSKKEVHFFLAFAKERSVLEGLLSAATTFTSPKRHLLGKNITNVEINRVDNKH